MVIELLHLVLHYYLFKIIFYLFCYLLILFYFFIVAGYIKDLIIASGLDVNVGLVQTAYSNGNSTKYVTDKLV